MAQRKQQIIIFVITAVLSIIIIGCANQISPPGGEVDKIPPYIIESYPENGAVDFNEEEVEFSFSEYVNKRNINDAFFISPLIEGYPEFSWTNKTVYIEFPESLKKNTTYSIIIGTEITDVNNNNNMKEPYILTFSTGSKIDSGKISGRVFVEKGDGTLIFAYKSDTGKVDIYNNKPDYLSQIDDRGNYEINGLSDGTYLVFAVKDDFKDLVYNIGDDLIGISTDTLKLTDQNRIISNVDFLMHKEDTLAPNIQAVTMTDKNHLVVEFNEPIDSSKMSSENFSIIDSTELKNYPIKFLFRQNSKKYEYILCISDSLNIDNDYYLSVNSIEDKYSNILNTENVDFIASDKPDTNIITLTGLETPYDKSQIDFINPSFELKFSDAFDLSTDRPFISMINPDSVNISLNIEKNDDASIIVNIEEDLKENTAYTLFVEMEDLIDAAGNKSDTILTKKLRTISDLEFTGASGLVNTSFNNVKVVLQNINDRRKTYIVQMEENTSFKFERVLPGEFLIWCYADADSNTKYTHGNIDPLKFSEYFRYYPDTLKLRARWPVGDITIEL